MSSTKPDIASVFRPTDHEFPCHDDEKFVLPKTRSVATCPGVFAPISGNRNENRENVGLPYKFYNG